MTTTVQIEKKISAKGKEIAESLHQRFTEQGIFVVNLIGSPGAGKTSVLEALAPALSGCAAVIEGDLLTDRDKARIEASGLPAYQINTLGACHLDAGMIEKAAEAFCLCGEAQSAHCTGGIQFLFIENVGNLVCPNSFLIGEDIKVAVISVTEGDDKPAKYPTALYHAAALLITKIDLLPYVNCNLAAMEQDSLKIKSDLRIFRTSTKTGEGIQDFVEWLLERRGKR